MAMGQIASARNRRVQDRYDELMHEGKHGHYETMFRVVREEIEREREACAHLADIQTGLEELRFTGQEDAARRVARAIRSRGELERPSAPAKDGI